jgi:chromosome partitioning protein
MIVAVAGQKGGVGKSTIAICLSAESGERGRRALLVDADPQGTTRTWGELATETAERSLWMPTIVAMGETMHRPDQLPRLAAGFDDVLIDCPPRHGGVQRSALMVADLALLPCGPSAADAWALASSIELVQEARTLRPGLLAAVVITRKKGRTALGKGARTMLEEGGLPVLVAELGDRIAYQEALAAGLGVSRYAPKDAAGREVRTLFDELAAFIGANDANAEKADREPPKAASRRARRR